MWNSLVNKLMDPDLYYKQRMDPHYYRSYYHDMPKFFKAIEDGNLFTVKACILLGGIDVNNRIRFYPNKRSNSDIVPIKSAILSYQIEVANFLLQCGADITDIIIRFTSKDKDSALSGEFNKTIIFCDLHNIPYEIVEEE